MEYSNILERSYIYSCVCIKTDDIITTDKKFKSKYEHLTVKVLETGKHLRAYIIQIA